jgi:predicted RNase H-like HicB family nuclease
MKIKVIVHEAEEGGYWAEVPAIPGCATQGETFEELLNNLYEAVEGCLSVEVSPGSSRGQRPRTGDRSMRSVSGREFARILERHG